LKYHLSKSPSKLEKILSQLNDGTKQPVEGDVKAIIDLEQKIKKVENIKSKEVSDIDEQDEDESERTINDKHAKSKEEIKQLDEI